jgi:hypothetical protein
VQTSNPDTQHAEFQLKYLSRKFDLVLAKSVNNQVLCLPHRVVIRAQEVTEADFKLNNPWLVTKLG